MKPADESQAKIAPSASHSDLSLIAVGGGTDRPSITPLQARNFAQPAFPHRYLFWRRSNDGALKGIGRSV